jgi:hypothetical protein
MVRETYLGIGGAESLRVGDGVRVASKAGLLLTGGRLESVFKVEGGPVLVVGMMMEVTEACEDVGCNITFESGPLLGLDTVIGDSVSIQAAAIGDWFWSECDGTAIVKAATGTALVVNGVMRGSASGLGILVPEGVIDVGLSATLATGKGTIYVQYMPVLRDSVVY